jgi:hypothetical protein
MTERIESNETNEQKKAILRSHYTISEIEEIIGYSDGSNSDCLPMDRLRELEETDFDAFEELLLDHAVINGNFEEVIGTDQRHEL